MTSFYDVIDEDTFELIASKAYSNPGCDINEFREDLNRIRFIKKLINKFKMTGDLKTQLILNHLIVWYNVFQPETCATKMLVYKLAAHLEQLAPFLLYLGKWPRAVHGLGLREETLVCSDIPLDYGVIRELQALRSHK